MSIMTQTPKIIDEIKFGVLSPQEIRKQSVVEIRTADTYDEDGVPIPSGLMDGRLGTLEPRQRCKTCGNTAANCLGHFGHIELAVPVVHISFAKIVHKVLFSTCRSCGLILLSDDKVLEFKTKIKSAREMLGAAPDELFAEILKETKNVSICLHCGARQYKTEFSKPTTFHEIVEEGGARPLTPNMIRERLERVPDEYLELLNLNPIVARPEWMVLQVLSVPPVYVRPSITLDSGIRSEDDLTHKLVDIIRINQRLKENIEAGAPTLIIQDLSELLQYHVTTYFDNEASGIPPARHRSGRALKTLSQRLKGKEGRFRSNLSGKRVDFSARTVISPDPNLDINEVGVPIDIAKRLSVPETVTPWNLEELKQLVNNGPDNYPGALYVVRPDERRIRLEFVSDREKLAESLQSGFIVERHLNNGDIAIFNRQPSLHRMSIMAHKVHVLPFKTFRLHLCVCPPYNADFDGDEMNLHIPQSKEAQTEASLLMSVQDQILSPRYGGPIIGAIRDFITAAYLLTKKETYLTKSEVCNLLTGADYDGVFPDPVVKSPTSLWTGKQIFSLFLPKNFNFTLKASVCRQCPVCSNENCEFDAYVVVKNGILESGVIDKNSIGAEKSDSLYHRIVKDYGNEAGRKFLNSICKLFNRFITTKGFTYALDELDLTKEADEKISEVVSVAEKNVRDLIKKYRENTLQRLQGQTLEDSLEIYIMNELAKARDKSGEVADTHFKMSNDGVIMTRTGARGSSLNIGQMAACVGQQSIRGKRITRGYNERSLSHFKPGDPSPAARGFVRASYRDGLNPIEFFFHAMGGREGLVDTAVRTQQSGYMQRRLINALEYLRVEHDETVRDPEGSIAQFKYGEDGVDPAKSDHGKAVNIERLIQQIKMTAKVGAPASKEYIENKLEGIVSILPSILISELKENILKNELSQKTVQEVILKAIENYKHALVEPGEAVGIIAAQSIGEPGTQMTLRTFHYAGVRERNVTLGLPRLIEIVDARRIPSTPTMTIYLDKEHRTKKEKATEMAQRIIFTTVNDLSSRIHIDQINQAIIIELDDIALKNRGSTIDAVKKSINIPNCEASEEEGVIKIITKSSRFVDLQKLQDKISKAHVKGIPGIHRAVVVEENGEWIVQTDGSNLPKILKTPGIDFTRTTTNNINEVASTIGIEAARNVIIREAIGVLGEQGLDVDIRHVMIVADVMTYNGSVRQIGRHGVSGEKASVLAKAAFEITVPTLVDASVEGQSDRLKGVTESVIIGQTVPIGTGLIELYMRLGHEEKNEK